MECHYRVAKIFHQKGIHASDDHLLNAFMYPNEFKSNLNNLKPK